MNKVGKTTLKLFLTSGVTLTVGEDEKLELLNQDVAQTIYGLSVEIDDCIAQKRPLIFNAVLEHPYKDEKGKDKKQKVKHFYHIPCDRISWFMIEEV